jgi:hypothetical protein
MKDRTHKGDSPIVDEVRERRSEISRRFGDDLNEYGKHLMEMQEKYRARLVSQVAVVPGREKPADRGGDKEGSPGEIID